jgi:hypothetical protein
MLVLAPTIGASNVHRGASKFSNVASVAIHCWEIEEFDSEISRAVQHRSWRLFQISMQGPFPAGYDVPCSIQLRDQAIRSSTAGPTRRHPRGQRPYRAPRGVERIIGARQAQLPDSCRNLSCKARKPCYRIRMPSFEGICLSVTRCCLICSTSQAVSLG